MLASAWSGRQTAACERGQVPEECPQEVADLLEECMDRAPENRPSAQEVFRWTRSRVPAVLTPFVKVFSRFNNPTGALRQTFSQVPWIFISVRSYSMLRNRSIIGAPLSIRGISRSSGREEHPYFSDRPEIDKEVLRNRVEISVT